MIVAMVVAFLGGVFTGGALVRSLFVTEVRERTARLIAAETRLATIERGLHKVELEVER